MKFDLETACLTLDEVLSASYEPLPVGQGNVALAQERMKTWIAISADHNVNDFKQRLQRQNLDHSHVLARLGGVRRKPGVEEPHWVERTRQTVELLREPTNPCSFDNVAFGPVLTSVVNNAAAQLRKQVPARAFACLAPRAMEDMADHLLKRLSNLVELPLYEVLLTWRGSLLKRVKKGDKAAEALLSEETLAPFTDYLVREGIDSLLERKPMLFRLMADLVGQWLHAYGTFLTRLAEDRPELRVLLPELDEDSMVERIGWGYSDPHNGGHSVLALDYPAGRIFYKPKDIRTDRFVGEFVAELTRLGYPEKLKVPSVILRDGYGWTENIEASPCSSRADIHTFYRRFGSWLALFHVLSSSDMHMENFIASGSDPVPVDFEMILQGLRQRPNSTDQESEADWLASRFLEASVQSVGMLPAYVHGVDGSLISMGALEPSVYPVRVTQWEDMNTPRMLFRLSVEQISVASNLPTLDGASISVADFRADFLAGFESTLAFVGRNAERLSTSVNADVDALQIRRVVRPTRFYYMLLKRLYDHRKMDDALSWSLEADFIARFFDWSEEAEQPWKLLASERRQLLRLGIPHFTMTSADNIIADAEGPVTRLHLDLGADLLRQRLATSSTMASDAQAALVRACLQMPDAESPALAHMQEDSQRPLASQLRDDLVGRAFQCARSMTWLSLNRVDHEVAAQLGLMGHDLYHGSGGVGLFLAALARSGDVAAGEQSRKALAATAKVVRSGNLGRLTRAIGIGGAVGLGSIVYALSVAGQSLDDEDLVDAARVAAMGLSDDAIAADSQLDVVAGSAGAALSLLALYRRQPADWILDRAKACGDHLLRSRSADGGFISSAFDRALTGAAHGAAGFALAFSRLFAATGDSRFRAAAQDCVAFENDHFDADLGNWRDLRSTGRAPNQWCYGAAGIGLSRLAMLNEGAVENETLVVDVEGALNSVLEQPVLANDSLCCGMAGHLEFLSLAGARLRRHDLLDAARQHSNTLSARWSNHQDFRWNGGTKAFNPGLFQGLSGIGFASLRAGGSDTPSPLIWD